MPSLSVPIGGFTKWGTTFFEHQLWLKSLTKIITLDSHKSTTAYEISHCAKKERMELKDDCKREPRDFQTQILEAVCEWNTRYGPSNIYKQTHGEELLEWWKFQGVLTPDLAVTSTVFSGSLLRVEGVWETIIYHHPLGPHIPFYPFL